MPAEAYILARIRIRDRAAYAGYARAARASIDAAGGTVVFAGDDWKAIEGGPEPCWLVLMRFPDAAAARAWHASPEFAPLRRMREAAADSELVLIEGTVNRGL